MTRRRLFGWMLSVAWAAACGAADDSVPEALARRVADVVRPQSCGAAVLVARDGKILLRRGYGLDDLTQKTPITPATKFRIGSITKQFTAAAILRLAESGKLTLDDSLAKFFPDFPRAENVTLRHLLQHTSGIQSYTNKPGFIGGVTRSATPAEVMATFRDDPPNFAPGRRFLYNNSGYFLLGEIIARVSGRSYADYLRETFFEPLGMRDTGVYTNTAPPARAAKGYSFAKSQVNPALDWDMSWAGGAGALYSTVDDLYRWNEALFGGRVLSEASFRAATTPVKLPPGAPGMKYGFGLMMSQMKRMPAVSHGGGLNGWSSFLLRVVEPRCTVVVLTNAAPPLPGLAPSPLAYALAEIALDDLIRQLPPLEEDTSIDPKTFAEYVGNYSFPRGRVLSVTHEDESLFAQLTGQQKLRIFPKAPDEFFWKPVDAQIVFLRDAQGVVYGAEHTQNNQSIHLRKLGMAPGGP